MINDYELRKKTNYAVMEYMAKREETGEVELPEFKIPKNSKTVFTWDSYPGEEREDLKNPPSRTTRSHDKPN